MARHRIHETVVLFMVGNQRFAMAANTIEEIRVVERLMPLPPGAGGSRAARHTFDARGRRFLAVDAHLVLRMADATPQHILVLGAADVGVLVGAVDRMHDIRDLYPLPHALRGEERRWYRGLALIDGQITPVLDPAAFLPVREAAPSHVVAARPEQALAIEAVPA
jgi:chemotaxis signal transduction protein